MLESGIVLKSVQATFNLMLVRFIFRLPFELVILNTASKVCPKYYLFIVLTFFDTTLIMSVGFMVASLASMLIKISTLSAGARVILDKLSTEVFRK